MKGLYRGFCRNENGTETIVLNGERIKGEWVQGNLVEIPQTIGIRFYIIVGLSYYNDKYDLGSCSVEVIEETVCEAVRGLTDRNGKQVFEGDMVKHYHDRSFPEAFSKGKVFYCPLYLRWKRSSENVDCCLDPDCHYEVIGTIFDEQFAEGV